jgi:hypothetical protein
LENALIFIFWGVNNNGALVRQLDKSVVIPTGVQVDTVSLPSVPVYMREAISFL